MLRLWGLNFAKIMIRKTTLCMLLGLIGLLVPVSIQAQDNLRKYKPFQMEVGIPFNFGMSESSSFGSGFYVAPRYAASDRVHIGIKTGGYNLGEGKLWVDGDKVDIEGVIVVPVVLTGDYYFNTDRSRPFIGLGIGMFRRNSFEFSKHNNQVNYAENEVKINPGLAPQIGVNSGHFRFSAAYNITGKSIANYASLNLGIDIGGGRMR
jgi:hypothetical protein